MVATLSLENPLFASFAFHGLLLLLKTLLMSFLTVRQRIKTKVGNITDLGLNLFSFDLPIISLHLQIVALETA